MRTLHANVRRAASCLVAGTFTIGALALSGPAMGQTVASDMPAGLVIYPKVQVNIFDGIGTPRPSVDTLIQLTNLSDELQYVNCWYVDAQKFCANEPDTPCDVDSDCPAGGPGPLCPERWEVTDVTLQLTAEQPVAWRASTGVPFLPCDPANPNTPPGSCTNPPSDNAIINPLPNPFQGELKCLQVDSDGLPVAANDLKGEATLYLVADGAPIDVADTATYNAIGIQATEDVGDDDVLCLGANDSGICATAEYAGCPSVLVLNHPFDSGEGNVGGATELTLVPCTENLQISDPAAQGTTTAQMLVYNEFEQRFSTSASVGCYYNSLLSDIDTRPGTDDNQYSIFALGVQGTITGQTRIRGVETQEDDAGHGLLGVAQVFQETLSPPSVGSAAYNLSYFADRAQADVLTIRVP